MNSQIWGWAIVATLLIAGHALVLWRQTRSRRAFQRATLLAARSASIPTYRAALEQWPAELNRARRYHHPLSLVVVTLEQPAAGANGNGNGNGNGHGSEEMIRSVLLHSAFAGCVLRDAIRSSDLVAYDPDRCRYLVALLDVNAEQAAQFVARLSELAEQRAQLRLRTGVAELPADGFLLEDLVSRAHERCLQGDAVAAGLVMKAAAGGGAIAERGLA